MKKFLGIRTVKFHILRIVSAGGKQAFLWKLKKKSKVLDVGCGNNSVIVVKSGLPQCYYMGLDIGDFNQTSLNKSLMDNYTICAAENFAAEIKNIPTLFDAVISSHNLEHCFERDLVLENMLSKIKPGGRVYLSFPCEESVNFYNRKGTLNFFDDETHVGFPPEFSWVVSTLTAKNFEIEFMTRRYKPIILWLLGLLIEPISAIMKTRYKGTWEFYGFESVIHARKNHKT